MESLPVAGPSTLGPPQLTAAGTKLLRSLEDAISQRSVEYKGVFVVTMYFASDDTDAKTDSKLFASTMKSLLGLRDTNMVEIVLPDDDEADICWNVEASQLLKLSRSFKGRKLFLLHFAGHGILNASKELILSGCHTGTCQEVRWALIDEFFLKPRPIEQFGVIDIACILDCCHSGASVRPAVNHDGTVEVLAASGARSITTGRKSENIEASFTQRFSLGNANHGWTSRQTARHPSGDPQRSSATKAGPWQGDADLWYHIWDNPYPFSRCNTAANGQTTSSLCPSESTCIGHVETTGAFCWVESSPPIRNFRRFNKGYCKMASPATE
ncbi:hypothetical protein TWF506_005464 [Arthrobotrys conoides]|uniref:Uncharacterized protein n=1 Tax=Arthrobotrys conoides TaxID=74498 RepID=A0AAN8NJA9_9PEZI